MKMETEESNQTGENAVLEISSDYTQSTSWLNKKNKNVADLIKRNIKNNISDPETARKVTEANGLERIKLGGTQFDLINGSPPLAPKKHLMEITEGGKSRVIEFNRKFTFEEAIGKIYEGDSKKIDGILDKYKDYMQKKNDSPAIQLAKKAGYVQGVCECVAVLGDDHLLGKKLLTGMNVTRDMAKKFANPKTYKTLEQGIFAQKPEQKLEQTHSFKR